MAKEYKAYSIKKDGSALPIATSAIVVGGSSTTKIINVENVEALPEEAPAGTIAIISTVKPEKVFASAVAPDAPAAGDVWLVPDTLPKVVYVISGDPIKIKHIYQYLESEWVSVSSYQYSQGEWQGALSLVPNVDLAWNTTTGTTITKTDENTVFSAAIASPANGTQSGCNAFVDLDVTAYNVMRVRGEFYISIPSSNSSTPNTQLRLAGINDNVTVAEFFSKSFSHYGSESITQIDINVDISALTGMYRFIHEVFTWGVSASTTELTLTEVTLL